MVTATRISSTGSNVGDSRCTASGSNRLRASRARSRFARSPSGRPNPRPSLSDRPNLRNPSFRAAGSQVVDVSGGQLVGVNHCDRRVVARTIQQRSSDSPRPLASSDNEFVIGAKDQKAVDTYADIGARRIV